MAKAYNRDSGGGGGTIELKDIYIRHGINLTRYSNYQAKKLLEILNAANVQIRGIIYKAKEVETKEQYHRLSSEIRHITSELSDQLNGQLKLDFKDLAEEETLFVRNAMRKVGVMADFDLPAPAKIWSAASFGVYAGYRTKEAYESYLDTFGDNVFKTWDSNVRAGYLAGLTAKQINRNVLGSVKDIEPGQMQALRKSLEMNTRTMVTHLAETARTETYKKNSGLFSGYRYVGTLDSRTCLVCGSLDGKIFEGSDPPNEPALPQHPNCRCLWLPEIKGMDGFDDDDTRASANGPVPANMSYEEWLKTQPDDVVKDILGPTRFNLYKSGMPITSFIGDNGTLTLEQIAEKEGFNLASGNTDDLTPAIRIYRDAMDYSDITSEAQYLNNSANKYGREFGSVITQDGKLIGTWAGTENTLNIPEQDFKDATRGIGSVDILHTHLGGTSFSYADMNTMCRVRKINNMMITLPNNDIYYLNVNNGYRPSKTELKTTWGYYYAKYAREEKARLNENELLPSQEASITMKVAEIMADMFKWSCDKI